MRTSTSAVLTALALLALGACVEEKGQLAVVNNSSSVYCQIEMRVDGGEIFYSTPSTALVLAVEAGVHVVSLNETKSQCPISNDDNTCQLRVEANQTTTITLEDPSTSGDNLDVDCPIADF